MVHFIERRSRRRFDEGARSVKLSEAEIEGDLVLRFIQADDLSSGDPIETPKLNCESTAGCSLAGARVWHMNNIINIQLNRHTPSNGILSREPYRVELSTQRFCRTSHALSAWLPHMHIGWTTIAQVSFIYWQGFLTLSISPALSK